MNHLDEMLDELLADAFGKAAPPPPISVIVAQDDDDEPVVADDVGRAEGQFFMIEYRDVRGRRTSRRITVFRIVEKFGMVPLLQCYCHERNANRSFRVDRIQTCIDFDGVVHDDVPAFLRETFGMSLAAASRSEESSGQADWNRIRACVRPHVVLLAALSHSDGLMLESELDVAVEHARWLAETSGFIVSDGVNERVRAYARRQRPTEANVWQAVRMLEEEAPEIEIAFFRAAIDLVDADGHRHPEEKGLINRIAVDMTGVPVL